MTESLNVLLVGLTMLAIIGLAISYILTALRRKKAKCPQCGARTPAAAAYYVDEETGQKKPAEPDIPFALVSASARLLIGLVAIGYVFAMLFSAIGYETCQLQGILMACRDAGSDQAALNVNLLYSLAGIVGGVIVMFNGYGQFQRALQSRGKDIQYEYLCSKGHEWTGKG